MCHFCTALVQIDETLAFFAWLCWQWNTFFSDISFYHTFMGRTYFGMFTTSLAWTFSIWMFIPTLFRFPLQVRNSLISFFVAKKMNYIYKLSVLVLIIIWCNFGRVTCGLWSIILFNFLQCILCVNLHSKPRVKTSFGSCSSQTNSFVL